MKNIKTKLLTGLIAILSMAIVGCSNTQSTESKETISESGAKEKIVDLVNDKYFVQMPYTSKESGDKVLGYICYFNDGKMQYTHVPNIGENAYKYENIDTTIEGDSIKYTLNKTYKGDEEKQYFVITKEQNNELKYTWNSTVPQDLKLITKDEVTKIINENFSNFKMNNFTKEFNEKYNLELDGLAEKSTSNNNSTNEDKTSEATADNKDATNQTKTKDTSVDNNDSSSVEESNQGKYRSKESAIARTKEIVAPVGVKLLNTDDATSPIFYEGRECWQFYIGSGDARVDLIYIDVETGQFKESINPSSDWRNEWHSA